MYYNRNPTCESMTSRNALTAYKTTEIKAEKA